MKANSTLREDELAELANNIVEIFSKSFKKPNTEETARDNLVEMIEVLKPYIQRKQLEAKIEGKLNTLRLVRGRIAQTTSGAIIDFLDNQIAKAELEANKEKHEK